MHILGVRSFFKRGQLTLSKLGLRTGIVKSLGYICLFYASAAVMAASSSQLENYYRTFWSPQYRAKPLDYCLADKKNCGKVVADRYCQTMGYDKSTKHVVAYDVGVTNYFATCIGCKGWNCQAFKQITCSAKHLHQPTRPYYFRARQFVYPRFNHYRVDWCYESGQGCGERAAFSFCRRMGYSKAKNFQRDPHIAATRALGNQRLCFGESCNGFKSITCYR